MKKTLHPIVLLALLCFAMQAQAQNTPVVLLRNGPVVFPENAKEYAQTATIGSQETVAGNYYRLLQFHQIPGQAGLDQLAQQGIKLLEYIPHQTYVAAIPTGFDPAKFQTLGVRAILPIPTDLKMSEEVLQNALPYWAIEKDRALLMLKFYKNIDHAAALRWCAEEGMEVQRSNGYNNFLRVAVPLDKVKEVATLPFVAFLELIPAPDVQDDIWGRSLHRATMTDTQFPGGRKYTGEGVNVLVRDDGFVGPHIDFKGRIDNNFVEPQAGSHGDGVAGVIGAAGNLDPWQRGMAAGANLFVVNYESEFLDETMDLFFNQNVIVTNSSYSNGCNAGYTEVTETIDQQLYSNPTLMHVFSAGNQNPSDCGYGAGNQWGNVTGGHKQAKNCITTANLRSNFVLENSSSRGPAHDGRLKPDISAHGTDQVSTDEENTYQVFGGTSAASPGIAGITAQMHQAYREHYAGQVAEAPTLKTILLNTANDLGNIGPDFKYGWGHVNAYRAVLAIEEGRWHKGGLAQDETVLHTITIPDGVSEARVMVYWADPEGTVMTSKALVNNLDITMTDAAGAVFMPWLLDPTPTVAALDTPAGHGVDTLNNMEQILLNNPVAGEYTLNIKGSELPFGTHQYYMTWEFRTADVTVTHPAGGEAFEPGDTIRVHWDAVGNAGQFTISASYDGGATYQIINVVGNGAVRHWDWVVPQTLSAHAKILVERAGLADVSDAEFTIAPRPKDVHVAQACPGYIRYEWEAVDLTSIGSPVSYEIYTLGDKYMEVIDTVTVTSYDLPTIDQNPTIEHWFAIRTLGNEGLRSERTIAVQWRDGLLECAQTHDLSTTAINSPGSGNVFGCGDFDVPVSVTIQNTGLTAETNVQAAYKFGNNAPVIETVPGTIEPGASVDFTFTTLLAATTSGDYTLEVYTILPTDLAAFNDQVSQEMTLSIYAGAGEPLEYSEGFEGDFPPPFYLINNGDNAFTWDSLRVIGASGDSTNAVYINNFAYNAPGEEDEMLVVPIDLTNATGPELHFDIAYGRYSATYFDSLRVIVSSDCGATFNDVVFNNGNTGLATVGNQTNVFFPSAASQWRTEVINLAPYIGHSVVVKFVNVNGFGNLLYLDNINVVNVAAPTAGFSASQMEVCEGESITFANTSTGSSLENDWQFGAGSNPGSSTLEGPLNVIFNQPGNVDVSLTVTNAGGSSTFTLPIVVKPVPVAGFTFSSNLGELVFANTSQFGDTYFWDFGDTGGSFSENPSHSYAADGIYTVVLTVSNECGSVTYSEEIEVFTTGVNDISDRLKAALSPNPNNGEFDLLLSVNQSKTLSLELTDVRGVVLSAREVFVNTGENTIHFEAKELASGLYFMKIKGEDGAVVLKVVIE